MEDLKSVQHEALEGQISAILFQDEGTGFAVASLELKTANDPGDNSKQFVTVAGEFAPVVIGTYLRLHGKWGRHPRFGQQFKVDWCEHTTPTTQDGLEKYLGSGAFPGIGKSMAKKLVSHFKEKTIEALESGAQKLRQVSGIGPKKAADLHHAFAESRNRHRILTELRGFGLNAGQTSLIYLKWGPSSIKKVQEDPYALIDELHGLGFKTADAIAMQLNIPEDSVMRARGVIRHLITESIREGHTCLPKSILEQRLGSLNMTQETTKQAFQDLILSKKINDDRCLAQEYEKYFYLTDLLKAEKGAASHLQRLLAKKCGPLANQNLLQKSIEEAEWPPDETQLKAIAMALKYPLSIITGGPGTGKTTTLRLLLDVLEKSGLQSIRLASPTGRAAKRLQEATGRKASTLHRLLGWEPATGKFQYDEAEPLEVDFLIVDEVSMLDISVAYALLRAIPNSCRVLLVGDANQLPSVGPGKVLRDLVESSNIPSIKLAHIHRQTEGSSISDAAHEILKGNIPTGSLENTEGDFFVITPQDAATAMNVVEDLVCERIPKKYGLDVMRDILVLSPMYKGPLGVNAINTILGEKINGKSQSSWADPFKEGDKIMVIKNDYEREVFNGDTGIVTKITADQVIVEIDKRIHGYNAEELKNLLPAYCVTVHRSQGSEARAVIVVITSNHWIMLRRNLLYTAITRGKDLVVVVTDKKALSRAVSNGEENHRFGQLKERIAAIS